MNASAAPRPSYSASIRYLYGLQTRGMKFGLRGIRRLLAATGHPERELRAIHIAGSNGKGSTAAMIASVFTAAGYRVGLYTSPHVLDFAERIRINGQPIPRSVVVRMIAAMRPEIERNRNTFFEAATAMAFRWFADEKVDLAVVETGLGGRLDATNVLRPVLSVITAISREHTQLLGTSLASIAREKGGIIKRNIPCVLGGLPPVARGELLRIARSRQAAVITSSGVEVRVRARSLRGTTLDLKRETQVLRGVRLALPGTYQIANLRTALQAVEAASRLLQLTVGEGALRKGLRMIRVNTGTPARLQLLGRRPAVLFDVAHNPAAIGALVESLRLLGWKKSTVVFGVMKDKSARGMLRRLGPVAARIVAVAPRTPRARPSRDIVRMCRQLSIPVEAGEGVAEGLSRALRGSRTGRSVLVTGSFFVVGEAMASLLRKKYLTISQ